MVFPSREIVIPQLHDEHTLLLLHGEDLADSSIYGRPLTNYGVTASAEQKRFESKSLKFSGSQSLTVPVSVSGDMTLEMWVYQTSYTISSYPTAFNWLDGSTRGNYAHFMGSGLTFGYVKSSGVVDSFSTSQINLNEWTHVAMSRRGSTLYGFVNGQLVGSVGDSKLTNDTFVLGGLSELMSYTYFQGYIDEVRLSDVARWTANFTPPTEPYRG